MIHYEKHCCIDESLNKSKKNYKNSIEIIYLIMSTSAFISDNLFQQQKARFKKNILFNVFADM